MVTTIGEGRLELWFSLQEKKKKKRTQVIPLIYKIFCMSNLIILEGKKEKQSYVIFLNYQGNFKEILMNF